MRRIANVQVVSVAIRRRIAALDVVQIWAKGRQPISGGGEMRDGAKLSGAGDPSRMAVEEEEDDEERYSRALLCPRRSVPDFTEHCCR